MKASIILPSLGLIAATSAVPQGTSSNTGNPFAGKTWYVNNHYGDEVRAAVKNISDPTLAAKAAKVAQIPTFYWK